MTGTEQPPVVTILCPHLDDRPPHLDALLERADVRYCDTDGLAEAIQGADALLLWDYFSSALEDVWAHADTLRWVHVPAAGVDRLLFAELVDSSVVVTNARGIFDRPIAEFVLALVLARAKGLHGSHDLQRDREWRHRETDTLQGATAMVVGTGAIGREIARLLTATGMRVRGAGRTARSSDPDFGEVVDSAALARHVGWADHVVLATPLTESTRGLVDTEVLAAMKSTAHLVNIARGPVVDEPALVQALREGAIAAASLDVFDTEPLPDDSPLWTLPGVVVTPHMAGDAAGWVDALAEQFVDNALRYLDGRELVNVVDKGLGFVPAARAPT